MNARQILEKAPSCQCLCIIRKRGSKGALGARVLRTYELAPACSKHPQRLGLPSASPWTSPMSFANASHRILHPNSPFLSWCSRLEMRLRWWSSATSLAL